MPSNKDSILTTKIDAGLKADFMTIAASKNRTASQIVRDFIQMYVKNNRPQYQSLAEGYKAMAEDADREREASEWCNGIIGDMTNETR